LNLPLIAIILIAVIANLENMRRIFVIYKDTVSEALPSS
jgi:hypothetical protein